MKENNNNLVRVYTPLSSEVISELTVGQQVLVSGVIYTARDAAHLRIMSAVKNGESLPFDLYGAVIYYAGPTPARPGQVIGSIGPTTSGRMDAYTPFLLEHGLKGMIGKGQRSAAVIESIIKNRAVYFAAIGGAGALLAKSVVASEIIAYEELGAEAVYRLEILDFPCIVAIDLNGNCIYGNY